MSRLLQSLLGILLGLLPLSLQAESYTIGSKNFNESYLLAEMVSQLLEAEGYEVNRRFGLGGTLVCYEALQSGEIDATSSTPAL